MRRQVTSTELLQDARRLLDERRTRLETATGKKLNPVTSGGAPLPEADRKHLLDEAVDLYWNELEWENLTEEEELEGGPVPEFTFPGFLALVRGMLLEQALPRPASKPSPVRKSWRAWRSSWRGAWWPPPIRWAAGRAKIPSAPRRNPP